jgi:hypothetical protein
MSKQNFRDYLLVPFLMHSIRLPLPQPPTEPPDYRNQLAISAFSNAVVRQVIMHNSRFKPQQYSPFICLFTSYRARLPECECSFINAGPSPLQSLSSRYPKPYARAAHAPYSGPLQRLRSQTRLQAIANLHWHDPACLEVAGRSRGSE